MGGAHHVLALAFDKDACVLVLPDDEGLGVLASVLEQVKQLLIVDLQEGAIDSEGVHSRVLQKLKLFEDMLDGPRDESVAVLVVKEALGGAEGVLVAVVVVLPVGSKHSVGLAGTCLAIGKYSCVKASSDIFNAI